MARGSARFLVLGIILLSAYAPASIAEIPRIIRLNDGKPIITRQMFEQAGAPAEDGMNINGPSLIRVPAWLKESGRVVHPDANYYLYFAHHKGTYIRMAWAKELEGPWRLYGVDRAPGMRGVLDLGPSIKKELGNGISIDRHVASPDVLVDDKNRRIVMYFHAPSLYSGKRARQRTFVATSRDGLDFNEIRSVTTSGDGIRPVFLGTSYFRTFFWKESGYAVANRGAFYRIREEFVFGDIPAASLKNFDYSNDYWEARPVPLIPALTTQDGHAVVPRHAAVMLRGNELWVFYTRAGDKPESILLSVFNLDAGGWESWRPVGPPITVLEPEKKWEGVEYPLRRSRTGPGIQKRELRDPAIFEDGGNYFLLYSGGGEEAIGIARLIIDSKQMKK